MQVKKANLTDTKFKLSIIADQKSMNNAKQITLRHLGSKHVKLPGFRAGKAPLGLIEKNVDQNVLQREFLEEIINRLYVQAVKAENLKPVEQPQVSIKKFVPFTVLEFDVEVEAVGNISLANYKNIKLERPKVYISVKDVNGVLDGLKKRLAERVEVERAAKTGDEVLIDFKGIDAKGEPINGAEGKEHPIIIGSNTFIPGFEPSLIGLKKGQEKTFEVTFPKDYAVKTLQNNKVTFTVMARKVHEVIEPKLDDIFASKAGPFKTLAELKTDIKKQLLAERQTEAKQAFENQLVGEITAKSKFVVPDVLVDEQVERAEQAERQNLAYRGQTWQEHLAEEGVSEEEHRKRNRPDAEANVKAGLILNEIADREGIIVTPEELEIRIQILKGQYKDAAMQTELDKPENKRDIESRLLTEKTLAILVQHNAQ